MAELVLERFSKNRSAFSVNKWMIWPCKKRKKISQYIVEKIQHFCASAKGLEIVRLGEGIAFAIGKSFLLFLLEMSKFGQTFEKNLGSHLFSRNWLNFGSELS